MAKDKYEKAMNDLNNYLLDIYYEDILTKDDVLKEVENVFGERFPEYEKT